MSEADTHNLQKIAQVLKSNGTDGELVIGFRDIAPEDIDLEEPVFIFYDGLPVPFFIDSFTRRGNNKALVHLTDITTLADAEEAAGKSIYMKAEASEKFDETDLSTLTGWTLFDENHNEVGIISDFFDIPGNPCIEAGTISGTVMIPLHEDLIISVDEDNRILTMIIPDGLV